jgi:hypothetical protein
VREEKKECGAFRNVVMTKSSPYFSCLIERIQNSKLFSKLGFSIVIRLHFIHV